MAFVTFSDLTFTQRGVTWSAELEDFNGASATNTLRLVSGTRRTGDTRMNPMNPILSSFCDVTIYDKGRVVDSRISGGESSDIRITIKKAGTIWHRGLLKSKNGGSRISRSNPRLRLTFNDGLPFLKTKNWNEQERAELLDVLHYICTDNTRTSLPTRVALAFNDTQADLANGRSRAFQHQMADIVDSGSYWDALSAILRYYNCQIFQQDGKWRVLQRSYRDPNQSYSWEEKDSGGTITTGTRNPTVSITDADIEEKTNSGRQDRALSNFVRPLSWRSTQRMEGIEFAGSDFTTDRTESISGRTVPEGWVISATSIFDAANDQIVMAATSSEFAEQLWTQTTVNPGSAFITAEEFQIEMTGEIDLFDTNSTQVINVDVAQIVAIAPVEDRRQWYRSSWSGTSAYYPIPVQENDSGSKVTRTFDISETITPPGYTNSGEWLILLRLLPNGNDPDGDGDIEVDEIRWTSASLSVATETDTDRVKPWNRGEFSVQGGNTTEAEQFEIGAVGFREEPTAFGRELHDPITRLRFLDTRTSDWSLLHTDSGSEHATRALGGGSRIDLGRLRLRDRYSMTSSQLDTVEGYIKTDTFNLNDTIEYDGKDYIPRHEEESIRGSRKRTGLIELKNMRVPSDVVKLEKEQ